jgi:cell division protein FtsL
MAAQAAVRAEYASNYNYGTAAPVRAPFAEPRVRPSDIPVPREHAVPRVRPAEKSTYGISLFAVVGAVFAAALMVFVVLAQISFREIAAETAGLNRELAALSEQEKRLGIEFESVIKMKEVEQYARDVLGMAPPDADQSVIIQIMPQERAEILRGGEEEGRLRGLGSFISSLLEYFK